MLSKGSFLSGVGPLFAGILGAFVFAACGGGRQGPAAPAESPTLPAATPTTPTTTPTATPTGQVTPGTPLGVGKLAYIGGGDLWVLDLKTGIPQQITSGWGFSDPRWSPSGDWISVVDEAGMWTVFAEGGEPVRVAASGGPWSPTADELAFATDDGAVWLVQADGSGRRELVPADGSDILDLAWTPDGQRLLFGRVSRPPNGGPIEYALWTVERTRTGLRRLYTPSDSGPNGPVLYLGSWSPDGRYLALWQGPDSASIAADGLQVSLLSADSPGLRELPFQTLVGAGFVAWSPEGGRLALVNGVGREALANKQIWVVDVDSGGLVHISDPERADISVAWSPDSERLAFASAPAAPLESVEAQLLDLLQQRRIWMAAADGSERVPLTEGEGFFDDYPQWSRDGAFILFVRVMGETPQLWIMGADGSDAHVVLEELEVPGYDGFGYYGRFGWGSAFDWTG